eukprot:TRINITY_DN12578_c0_g1_i1.p1 TRINITY_DN12578_c0_g1~~TRINITY_DN12578_c0_g1_i1.p1  ORF type:complete len:445 (+),score=70.76 TRINITY_DN12578_c0_g1_i1:61-1335(+)
MTHLTLIVSGDVPTQKIKLEMPGSIEELMSNIGELCEVQVDSITMKVDGVTREPSSVEEAIVARKLFVKQKAPSPTTRPQPTNAVKCQCSSGEVVQFHCQEDGTFVCAICAVVGRYKGRPLQTLQDAASTYLAVIPSLEGKIRSEVIHMDRLLAQLRCFEASRDPGRILHDIHEKCDHLVNIVNQKRIQMEESVLQSLCGGPSYITAERNVLLNKRAELSSLQDLIKTSTGKTPMDIVSALTEVREKLPMYLDVKPVELPVRVPSFDHDQQLAAVEAMCVRMMPSSVVYPGANTFKYQALGGATYEFDVSTTACGRLGFYHLQRVRLATDGSHGTVIGVLSDLLWWHRDKDPSASPVAEHEVPHLIITGYSNPSEYPESVSLTDPIPPFIATPMTPPRDVTGGNMQTPHHPQLRVLNTPMYPFV